LASATNVLFWLLSLFPCAFLASDSSLWIPRILGGVCLCIAPQPRDGWESQHLLRASLNLALTTALPPYDDAASLVPFLAAVATICSRFPLFYFVLRSFPNQAETNVFNFSASNKNLLWFVCKRTSERKL
jgi:hypothetical protein